MDGAQESLAGENRIPADIAAIAERLRLIRTVSQQRRYHGRATPHLPSKALIIEVLNDVIGALYPRHFGPAALHADETDAHVARVLTLSRQRLSRQIELELLLADDADADACHLYAEDAAAQFLARLVRVRDLHDTDIAAAYAGDPSAKSLDEVVFCFPGVAAILRHRLAHELYLLGATMIARIMAEDTHSLTGIDIHPGARIGPAFFADHGSGVVIGETAVIGRNVRLYQHVTLGAKRFEDDGEGNLVKGQPRHPVIEDDVVLYAGATILGRITIGRGSIIGGGVWLTRSLPPGSAVTQATPELAVAALRPAARA